MSRTRNDSTNATYVSTVAVRQPAPIELKPLAANITLAQTAVSAVTDVATAKVALQKVLDAFKAAAAAGNTDAAV